MKKIILEIIGMSYSQSQSGAYALIMGEKDGTRRLPIIIGGFEAQSIAIELEKMKPSRPLTHDLFKSFADQYNVEITEVIINKFLEGVFFAKLLCTQNGKTIEIDSRTSDAVALAIRFKCPIYTYEKIMADAGIIIDEKDEDETSVQKESETSQVKSTSTRYSDMSLNQLYQKLKTAVDAEEYEKASLIRDEISRRKAVG